MTAKTSSPDALDLLTQLVGFDTTSYRSNLEFIEFARDYLESFGATCRLSFDESGKKANLFATLGPKGLGPKGLSPKGLGPADIPGIVLSGHSDVVPVAGQDWSSDPFTLTQKEGLLYGRGSADMKGFIACALALVPKAAEAKLKIPLHIALSYDEEVGCIGVRRLLEDLATLPVKPLACIVGEPTNMNVVTGHKGKRSLSCHARGQEGHSALGTGVNAIEAAAEVISFLSGLNRSFRENGPFNPAFTPPQTTINTGTIEGGTALNIVPRDCHFDFEIRHLPGHDPQAIISQIKDFTEKSICAEMQARAPGTGISFHENADFPGLDTPDESPVCQLAKSLSGANQTAKVSYGTEAGLFHLAGIPAIVCGPGSIEQAHRADEFISKEQIALCGTFMERLLEHLCS